MPGLHEKLDQIRYFRKHQAEHTEKVKAAVLENDTPFANATVDIMPHDGSHDLCVYAVVILSTACGIRFVYRETIMHYALVSPSINKDFFDACVKEMLADIHGDMHRTRSMMDGVAS